MSLSVGYSQFSATQYNFGLQDISFGQMKQAQSLMNMFQGFQDPISQFMPNPMEMMLQPPMGYLRGGGQAMAAAAGYLQGFQDASMMNLSMGSRMMMGLSMFQSGSLMGNSFQINQLSINANGVNTPQGKDRFAVNEGCRTGLDNPSNLQNSPHVKLALYNILKDHPDDMPPEELKKELEDKYGIKSEITTVKSKEGTELKALKFENGDVLADGSGNGSFGMSDYDLKGAVKDIQDQYGVTPEDFDKQMTDLKDRGVDPGLVANDNIGGGGGGGYGGGYGDFGGGFKANFESIQGQFQSAMPFLPFQPFFPMQDIAHMFAQAMSFSQF